MTAPLRASAIQARVLSAADEYVGLKYKDGPGSMHAKMSWPPQAGDFVARGRH